MATLAKSFRSARALNTQAADERVLPSPEFDVARLPSGPVGPAQITLDGTNSGETLNGTEDSDTIHGLGGDDTINGLGGADTLFGDGGNDTMDGGEGDDVMDGGTENDTMSGGNGNDDLNGAAGNDALVGGDGTDVLKGRGGNDNLSGGAGDDVLDANEGNDVLNGGTGADNMFGGEGEDIYYIDNVGDNFTEGGGHGTNDIVYVSINYVMPNDANHRAETLAVDPATGTAPINITGNSFTQFMIGNAGNNIITGGLTMRSGGAGDDTYFGGGAVTELAGQGFDTIYVTNGFALLAGVEVEVLRVVDPNTTHSLGLIGNEFDNHIIAGNGSDLLDGGISGHDVLEGNGGNDSYVVGSADTIVVEAEGQGADLLSARVSYVLAPGVSVENLGTATGAAIDLTGNELANFVSGNDSANRLDGGAGTDLLQGRGGADIFAFTTALGGDNVDTIVDFTSGSDKIGLDEEVFAGVNSGNLASVFVNGTAAQDADDRLIYDTSTNQLYYDADGNGAGAKVLFASFQGSVALTANDFVMLSPPTGAVITGTPNDDELIGGVGDDTINALGGNDILDGRQGADTMDGGAGDDQYFVDDAGDVVIEANGGGYDFVFAAVDYQLGAGVYVEVLATVNNFAITAIDLTGNELDNYVTGNAGANILNGGGGADQLWGREGDDGYFADMNDSVVEYAGQGNDTVYASASYVLAAGLSVETLATADNLATTAINLTGNELDNQVIGNAGANTLDGGSGGADQLSGRQGDDSYFVDANDSVIELAGQGNDTVYARASYALAAGLSVETLATANNLATTAINLTGNELNNYVTGNAGANVIDGGLGADQLWGREGDDTYFVDFERRRCRLCGPRLRHHLRAGQLCAERGDGDRSARHRRQQRHDGDRPDRQRARQLRDRQCRRQRPQRRRGRGPAVRPRRGGHLRLHHRARLGQCRYGHRLRLGHGQDRPGRRDLRWHRHAGQLRCKCVRGGQRRPGCERSDRLQQRDWPGFLRRRRQRRRGGGAVRGPLRNAQPYGVRLRRDLKKTAGGDRCRSPPQRRLWPPSPSGASCRSPGPWASPAFIIMDLIDVPMPI